MASHSPGFTSPSSLPLSAVLASIPSWPRPVVQRLVTRLIDHLDDEDGDPDLEDATNAEDEGITWSAASRDGDFPGCPVSDPGSGNVDDKGEWIDEREPDWLSIQG